MNLYQPEKGVSMGSPISSTRAEIFLHHLEDIHIKQLLNIKNITFNNDRYVTEASNKTKAMWQLINREIGKTQEEDY